MASFTFPLTFHVHVGLRARFPLSFHILAQGLRRTFPLTFSVREPLPTFPLSFTVVEPAVKALFNANVQTPYGTVVMMP